MAHFLKCKTNFKWSYKKDNTFSQTFLAKWLFENQLSFCLSKFISAYKYWGQWTALLRNRKNLVGLFMNQSPKTDSSAMRMLPVPSFGGAVKGTRFGCLSPTKVAARRTSGSWFSQESIRDSGNRSLWNVRAGTRLLKLLGLLSGLTETHRLGKSLETTDSHNRKIKPKSERWLAQDHTAN